MPEPLTVARLLLEHAVPDDLRDGIGKLDVKGSRALAQKLATLHPEKYRDVMKKLSAVSVRAGWEGGGYSFGPEHMEPGPKAAAMKEKLNGEIDRVLNDRTLTPDQRDAEMIRVGLMHQQPLAETIYEEHRAARNPLAMQVESGAKGKADNLKSLVAGDTLYTDQNDQIIPFVVNHSFHEGLRPAEFFAGTYGARKALALTKLGTADGGYLSKRLSNAAHRLVVTSRDGEDPHGGIRGLPTTTDDADNEGALLAAPVGGHSRNTVLTSDVLADLKRKGIKDMLVRSPMVGGPMDGGVYGADVGVRERGDISPTGDFVGIAASNAIAEPITQMIIGCLVRGTMVRMADWSEKPIESVCVGDLVLGADSDGHTFPVKVTRTYDNGQRDCLKTVFGFGKRKEEIVLESTADHKLLAMTMKSTCKEASENGVYRQLAVGKIGDRFYAKVPTGFDDTGLTSEPFDYLLGLLLGDGCFTESIGCNPHLSCADQTLIDDLQDYLAGLNLKLTRLDAGGGLTYRLSQIEQVQAERDPATGRVLAGYRNPAKLMLDRFGLLGKSAHEKSIPEDVYRWSNDSVAAVLAGLFVTDGSIYQVKASRVPFAAFGSTSRRMVEQFRELLAWRFGIFSGPIGTNTTGRQRELYDTEIAKFSDVKRLYQVMCLRGVKRGRYDKLVSEAEQALESTNVRNRGRVDSEFRLKRRSQAPIGSLPTYDIEVDHPDHLFVLANGLIVSNSKHSGGVAGSTKGQTGFPVLDRLFSIPSTFPGGATHAQKDGMVGEIREAPQGGHYVSVDGESHYVRPDMELTVKPGDVVEAGDVMSEGTPNPAEFAKHKGVGEARRLFLETFNTVAKASGFSAHRRNVELITRGLIDHVHIDKEVGDYSPGEYAPYSAIEAAYEPRDGHKVGSPKEAIGSYLERPVLHYTIGTQVKPSMLPRLQTHGVDSVTYHAEPPPFSPVMIRSQDTLKHDPDWMTQMLGSGLERNLTKSVARGAVADPMGTSYVPGLAEGINFGRQGKTVGWNNSDILPASPVK